MEIPTNKQCDKVKEEFINKLVKELETRPSASIYYYDGDLNENLSREIGYEFRQKGYYARMTWHANSYRTFFYELCIGKNPLRDINAPLAWSRQL